MSDITQEELKGIIEKQALQEKKLEMLTKENKELRGLTNQKGMKKLTEVTRRTATSRMIDDRIVIGFKNRGSERRPRYIYEKPDPLDPKTLVNYVDVILEGIDGKEETVVSVKHIEFLEEAEIVKAEITNQKPHEWVINQGSTRKKEMDGYSLMELDFSVDLDVKGVTIDYVLKLPEEFGGREVTVYQDYLNI